MEFFTKIHVYVIFIIFCTKISNLQILCPKLSNDYICHMLFFGLFWTFWKSVSYIKYLRTSLCQTKTKSLRDDFLFSFAVNVNEQRIIAFLTEKCCYLKLRTYTK